MNNRTQNVTASMMRLDYGRVDQYTGLEPPKLTFWQKLGRGLGKFMSFAGPIGAAVSAVALPGIGLPIAAGLYGLTRMSQDQLYKAQIKDQFAMANQSQPTNIYLPGLFDTVPLTAGALATDFMAPQSMVPDISQVIIRRNDLHQGALQDY